MKFLIDENVPNSLIHFLEIKGYKVLDIKTSTHSQDDDEKLVKLSIKENYIIITFDKDFLIIKKRQKKLRCIFLNLKTINIDYLKRYLEKLLRDYKDILTKNDFFIFCKKDEIVIL